MQVFEAGATRLFLLRFESSCYLFIISMSDQLIQDRLKQLADFMLTHIHNREGAA